jgi:hypothetical protein
MIQTALEGAGTPNFTDAYVNFNEGHDYICW